MNMIREIVKGINEKEYTNIKIEIMNESSKYIRDCSFIREILFDYINNENDITDISHSPMSEDVFDEGRLEFRIQLNRYNAEEIYLYEKSISGSVVNEAKTKLTKEQVSHILDRDYDWMLQSEDIIINQLAMQMRYNYCYPVVIREYFQEKYYNIYQGDMMTMESMELYLENDTKEFFNDNLTPIKDIDYNNIKLYYRKKIAMPAIGYAGSMK